MMQPNTRNREGSPSGERNAKAGRIVILDDHAVFRQALAVTLEHAAGFEVCADIDSPEAARTFFEGLDVGLDLAIVDLDLPDGSAEELIREIGKSTSGVAVLGLTANRDRVGRIRGTSKVLTTAASVDEIIAAAVQLVG